MTFQETLDKIQAPDADTAAECVRLWDAVAKPLKSLGLLEELTVRMAGVQRCAPPHAHKRRVLVFCADNGVVAEGVSQSDSAVTAAVAESLAAGRSNVNIFARTAGAEVRVWDVGMVSDVDHPQLGRAKTARGTRNFTQGPAMHRDQAVAALEAGIHAAEAAVAEGCDVLIAGEMGIGNTTTSAAVLHLLLGVPIDVITGRGSGLDDAGLARKRAAIARCIQVNHPDPTDPMDVLCCAGGFDIAAMCGVYLAGAALGVPCLLDGLISGAAAVLATRFAPQAAGALIASHCSKEPGGSVALEALGLRAPICADMALGEGTGGVALLPLIDLALAELSGGHSFDSIGIDAYVPQG